MDSRSFVARQRLLIAIVIATTLLVVAFLGRSHFLPPEPPGTLRLSDGVEIFYIGGTRVSAASGYPQAHEVRIDGDAFVRQPATNAPLLVRTRLLILSARGPAEFRVTAYSKETGEQVEVLEGMVEARKAYASPYAEPDILESGEMSMINHTIDLMEKEKTDVVTLRNWRDALIGLIQEQSRR